MVYSNGINPLELIAVIPIRNKAERFLVKEGNRRVAVLKLLNNPHLAGVDRLVKRYRDIGQNATTPIPREAPCVMFRDAVQVTEWIFVKHAADVGGAGTVRWDPIQRGRFNLRNNRPDQHEMAYRVLDNAVAQGWVTEEAANAVNVTSLTRVLKDRDVQKILYVRPSPEHGLLFDLKPDASRRVIRRLVKDWSKDSGLKVERIYGKQQRRDYAGEVATELRLARHSTDQSAVDEPAKDTLLATTPARVRHIGAHRKSLVPRNFVVGPHSPPRLVAVLDELKRIQVHKYPNAVAVLLRTFVEASVDMYIQRHGITVRHDAKLTERAQKVVQYLKEQNKASKQELKPVNSAISNRSHIFSFATLNEYVHNVHWHPAAGDLIRHWDSFSAFLSKVSE